jgi:hypothetical protein
MIGCLKDEGSDLVGSKAERLGVVEVLQEQCVDLVGVECAVARSAIQLPSRRAKFDHTYNRWTGGRSRTPKNTAYRPAALATPKATFPSTIWAADR